MVSPRFRRACRERIGGAALSGLLLIVAACGGSDSSADDPSSDTTQATDDAGADELDPDDGQDAPEEAPATSGPSATPTSEATAIQSPTPVPEPTPVPTPTLNFDVAGLPDLDGAAVYEAWLIVDGGPVSAGTFRSFAGGVSLPVDDGAAATAVVLTIETDDDPAPSETHVLAGPLVAGGATLSVADPGAIGVDFGAATGEYILATPTDGTGSPENERSGIWWTFIPRAQSLVLPELPPGWIYEGWQVIDGRPVTTGTFVSQFGEADLAAPFSGPQAGPPFPGEDFLANAPAGLEFPRDLRGTEVVITVEPLPDTSADPFPIVPLRGTVPSDAIDHRSYPVDNVADAIVTGTAVVS